MIYLDYQASTPVLPEVIEAMTEAMREHYANPAADHLPGTRAKAAIAEAKEEIAKLAGFEGDQLYITSGATESDNLAILGVMRGLGKTGDHAITTAIEHPAVLGAFQQLEKEGFEVTYIGVDSNAQIDWDEMEGAVQPNTKLISVMTANNEVGTINDLGEVLERFRGTDAYLHTDAAQAFGHIDRRHWLKEFDLVSVSAHKMYGPKGIGGLFVRESKLRRKMRPLMFGGGHQKGIRPGTENVPGVVGWAKAAKIAGSEDESSIGSLRDELETRIEEASLGTVNCKDFDRLPYASSIRLLRGTAAALRGEINDRVAIAEGSACSSGKRESSHVLRAMGLTEKQSREILRISLGRDTTERGILFVIEMIQATHNRRSSLVGS